MIFIKYMYYHQTRRCAILSEPEKKTLKYSDPKRCACFIPVPKVKKKFCLVPFKSLLVIPFRSINFFLFFDTTSLVV